MAFWNKKNLYETLVKAFKNDNISLDEENSKILSFEISFSEAKFNLYPYFKINEEESILSIECNVRKIEKENVYEKINNFNIISKYFTLKLKDNILYLEYNTKVNIDNVYEVAKLAINSLSELQFEIDKI